MATLQDAWQQVAILEGLLQSTFNIDTYARCAGYVGTNFFPKGPNQWGGDPQNGELAIRLGVNHNPAVATLRRTDPMAPQFPRDSMPKSMKAPDGHDIPVIYGYAGPPAAFTP